MFGIKRNPNIETLPNSYKSYNLGTDYEPLPLRFKIWSDKPLTQNKRVEICDWLFKDEFCELHVEPIDSGEKEVIYYCKLQGEQRRFIAGNESGYLDVEVINYSPCAWGTPQSQFYDLRKPPDGENTVFPFEFPIENNSNYNNWYDLIFKIGIPESEYTSASTIAELEFTMWNKSNSKPEEAFVISSRLGSFPLQYGEYLQIDMNSGEILTNKGVGTEIYMHRRKNCNNKFITLNRGANNIAFSGNCLLEVVYQRAMLV